jgi:hypothetical protein
VSLKWVREGLGGLGSPPFPHISKFEMSEWQRPSFVQIRWRMTIMAKTFFVLEWQRLSKAHVAVSILYPLIQIPGTTENTTETFWFDIIGFIFIIMIIILSGGLPPRRAPRRALGGPLGGPSAAPSAGPRRPPSAGPRRPPSAAPRRADEFCKSFRGGFRRRILPTTKWTPPYIHT